MTDGRAPRIAVFIDYQNCYGTAREAFHDPKHDPVQWGNVRPKALAMLLASKGGRRHDLVYTGVYTGLPDATLDPQTNRARLKQIAAWESAGAKVVSRPLRYPPKWSRERPQEKGVDVKLAIDAVMMAVRGEYDIAVLASCDTDLVPLAEALLELESLHGTPSVEVIAWKGRASRIGVKGRRLVERWVGPNDYASIRDQTDYNL